MPSQNRACRGLTLLLLGLIVCQTGCRWSARRSEPLVGPFHSPHPKVQRGEVAFMQHCHACHPGGAGGLGPSLNDKPLPAFMVKGQVRWGLGAMPHFHESQLSSRQLDDITAYLAELRRHNGRRAGP